jgi:F-type H+-transporting ATPase subunit b
MVIALNLPSVLLSIQDGESLARWLDYPGFEAWKFFNIFLFVGVLVWLLRDKVRTAMEARRAVIRSDLMRALEERNAAEAKLAEVEARLAHLNEEIEKVREQSRGEAIAERERLARTTEEDAEKLRMHARREIESASKVARQELRRFAAAESVHLAEQLIRRDIRPEDDGRLLGEEIEELRGLRH